jgi:hypothetical protein
MRQRGRLPCTGSTGAGVQLATIGNWAQTVYSFHYKIVTISKVFPTITPCPVILKTQHLRRGECGRRWNYSDGLFLETETKVIIPDEV